MAFPTALSSLQDNIDSIIAAHINNIEVKIGIDGSTNAASLDYKIRHLPAQEAALAMGTNKITGVVDPTANQEAATKKYVDDIITAAKAALFPIGSIYSAIVATNPATLLGFGTWVRIAEGQMLVGYKTGDSDFGTVEATGGAKTSDALIAHTHTGPSHTHTGTTGNQSASHTHALTNEFPGDGDANAGTGFAQCDTTDGGYRNKTTAAQSASHTHAFTSDAAGTGNTGSAGSGASFSILNPFYVIYIWKRTV